MVDYVVVGDERRSSEIAVGQIKQLTRYPDRAGKTTDEEKPKTCCKNREILLAKVEVEVVLWTAVGAGVEGEKEK
jgi:hypothetical protein